jgi:hypothetical protein
MSDDDHRRGQMPDQQHVVAALAHAVGKRHRCDAQPIPDIVEQLS